MQGKRERGPVGEKKSEGGYASPSSPVEPGRPPPPLSLVFTRQNAFLQSKTPLYLTCLVLCYGQPTEAQQLARAGQTAGVGMVRLMLGGPRVTGWNGLPSASCGAAVSARGRCLWRGGCNAFTSCTNYFPHTRTPALSPHARTRPHSAARPTVTPLVHSPSRTHSHARTHQARTHYALFFAYRHFFVAYLCKAPYFCPRMNNTSLIDSLNAELQSAQAELLALRTAGTLGMPITEAYLRILNATNALMAYRVAVLERACVTLA